MTRRLMASAAAISLIVAACTGSASPSPEPEPGPPDPRTFEPELITYSPTFEGMGYVLPSAVSGLALSAPPPGATTADELELSADPLIHRNLVERGLGPSVIRVAQRSSDYTNVPLVSTTALTWPRPASPR